MSNLEIISKCDVRQQFLFLTTCLGRTKNLYSLFEVEIKHDKFDYANKFKNASEKINKFYQECLSILFDNSDSFNTDPNLFYELAPSYEEYSTVTATIATQIALLCTSVGEFYMNGSIDAIQETLLNIEEIINIVKSENFERYNLAGNSWEYVQSFLEKEKADQSEILKRIEGQNLDKQLFNELVDKYKIIFL